MAITTCLFDLDGTLVDSIPLIVDSFRHAITAHTDHRPTDQELIAGIGTPLVEQLGDYTDDPNLVDKMVETYRDYYIDKHNESVKAYRGVREGLTKLRDKGIKLGIVTSKNQIGAQRSLGHTQLLVLFDTVITIDETTEHKPKPAPVFAALTALESKATEAVFVGDSTHDLKAGRAAGVITAAVSWGPFDHEALRACKPDLWLTNPKEDFANLPELASQL